MYSGSNSLCLYSLQCAAGAWHWIYLDINMHFVGQLLIFGILLSVFMDIEGRLYDVKVLGNWSMFSGLQCWDNNKGQKDVSTLKECSESLSTSCFIVESISWNELEESFGLKLPLLHELNPSKLGVLAR